MDRVLPWHGGHLGPAVLPKTLELFAYMRRIVNAACKYEGSAWVTYDRVYRRQAASRHTLNWLQEDQVLYNEVIAGWARQCTQCRHCLSEHHTTETCPDVPIFPFPFPVAPADAGSPAISSSVQRGTGNSAGNITRTGASTTNVSTFMRAACATAPTQQRHVPLTATATPTHGGSPSQPGCPDHERQRSFGRPHAVIQGYSQCR